LLTLRMTSKMYCLSDDHRDEESGFKNYQRRFAA